MVSRIEGAALYLFSRGSELLPDCRRRFEKDHLVGAKARLTLTYYNIDGDWGNIKALLL